MIRNLDSFLLVLCLQVVKNVRCVCFTGTLKKDVLRFVCKINHLIYDVSILDKYGSEAASCLIPSSHSHCIPYLSNMHISQDLMTNTTVLTIWHADNTNSYYDNWICRHGRGKEEATAEVTVISDECYTYEKYLAWTLVGLLSSYFLLNVLKLVIILYGRECLLGRYLSSHICLKNQNTKSRIAFYLFLCLIIIAVLSVLPIYLGIDLTYELISPKYFIIDGVLLGICCHVMSCISGTKEKESKTLERSYRLKDYRRFSTS